MIIEHKYDTEKENDVITHNHHHNALTYYCALAEIKRYVRTMYKHVDMCDEAHKHVSTIYEMICEQTKELDI